MSRKTIAPDQRVLRRCAFGIGGDVGIVARTGHCDLEIHQFIVHQKRFNALILRHEFGFDSRFIRRRAGCQARQCGDQDEKTRFHDYSAAIFVAARPLAFADSSAIRALARATGFVR